MAASREKNNIDIRFSKNSALMDRLYTKAGALTIFWRSNVVASLIPVSIVDPCFNGVSGYRDHENHGNWHKSESEFDTLHAHLFKVNEAGDVVDITIKDVECFFLEVKKWEAEVGLCEDGISGCFVADDDMRKIAPGFQRQYIPTTIEMMQSYGKSYIHSFLSTLIDKYFIPYLITHRFDPETGQERYGREKIECAKIVFRASLAAGLSLSLTSICAELAIQNVIKPALIKIGFNNYLVERVSNFANTVAAFTVSPSMLMATTGGAMMGQEVAYNLIRCLPKLRNENEVAPVVPANDAPAVDNEMGLRHRNLS